MLIETILFLGFLKELHKKVATINKPTLGILSATLNPPPSLSPRLVVFGSFLQWIAPFVPKIYT